MKRKEYIQQIKAALNREEFAPFLLHGITGSGKTYALWFPILLQYLREHPDSGETIPGGLKAVWITPLRALSQEIRQSAERITRDRSGTC